jgi:hypothetical protein
MCVGDTAPGDPSVERTPSRGAFNIVTFLAGILSYFRGELALTYPP